MQTSGRFSYMLVIALFVIFRWPRELLCQRCQESITGIHLQNHTYSTMYSVRNIFDCNYGCLSDKACQSFNYFGTSGICELNNRTRQSRENHVVYNATSVYYENPYRVSVGSIAEVPALSCKELRDSNSNAESGRYWVLQSGLLRHAFCNMTTAEIIECPGETPCYNNGTCEYQGGGQFVCNCQANFTGNECEIVVAHECQNYSTLNESNRNIKKATIDGKAECDTELPKDWYRITGKAGTRMREGEIPELKCGTNQPGWLNTSHPTIEQGRVLATVCFSWRGTGCYGNINISVRDCGAFYVYDLPPTNSSDCRRYCGENSN